MERGSEGGREVDRGRRRTKVRREKREKREFVCYGNGGDRGEYGDRDREGDWTGKREGGMERGFVKESVEGGLFHSV